MQPEDLKSLVALYLVVVDVVVKVPSFIVFRYGEEMHFYQLAFDENLKSRGMAEFPPKGFYPYRDDGLLTWNATYKFVSEYPFNPRCFSHNVISLNYTSGLNMFDFSSYLRVFYTDDKCVVKDMEVRNWINEMLDPKLGALRGVLPPGKSVDTLTVDDLVRLVATMVLYFYDIFYSIKSKGESI